MNLEEEKSSKSGTLLISEASFSSHDAGSTPGKDGPTITGDRSDEDIPIAEDLTEPIESFEDMGLPEDLLRGIYRYGFEKPSAIQQQAIRPVSSGRDLIAQAQSGTGKAGTFSIGTLATIDPMHNAVQSIVLSPTRELAQQTYDVLSALGDIMGVRARTCIGGRAAPVREDIRALKSSNNNKPQVIIGTPGRVLDLVQRGALQLNSVLQMILDEADEMLSIGFRDQIYQIFQFLPESVQICLFSATLPLEVMEVSERFLRDPVRVLVKRDELTLRGIQQFYIAVVEEGYKLETLCDLYESLTINQAIIYCNTKKKAEWLSEEMQSRDFTVSCIHGELEQEERMLVMREFRAGASRVLISTDLLARGIDVQQVSLVINFDLPVNRENYIHRIGRSGRFGRKGVAINFIADRDIRNLRDIETFYATEIVELPQDIPEILGGL
mmetsp:Transcript_25328/g.52696  ORF Transcript_25328/g.52696 Transcript_25328/m.52696 type:complete len:440 (-) Transcript_25328:170-1489(-)|eukprot:CAMPEP_0172439410 /NCGR_PEP_ID=MMETSP1065-20121228/408_1 /TAXON_ID=265537 /ORGANISM="Amphiprora paludosa, Strain CCMP125" /LENGTH=439 /DNA_ID=CAMNT_0013188091 /DNA_START=129 /DNA_END=1448 /DNA_ORIENTATION=-